MMVNVPHCLCDCDEECMPGYESFHPDCHGGTLMCGACGACPENSFGEFCECTADGEERPRENVSEQIPNIKMGQRNNLTGNGVHKFDDKFSFSHAIIDKDTPDHHLKCNETLCTSIAHCSPRTISIFGDHQVLPGAEITMKFSPNHHDNFLVDNFFLGIAVPSTDESLLVKGWGRSIDFSAYIEEFYGWKIYKRKTTDGAFTRFGEYEKGWWDRRFGTRWRSESIMKYKEKGQFKDNNLIYTMNTTTLTMRVTETEVIWSWDGFTEGINERHYGYEFVAKSDARELKHKINTRARAFYPIITFSEHNKAGDFSSIQIIDSKIGKD